ncbi:MAG: hypothetical protein ABI600_04010 [Luteolibacter sp.]
MRVTINNQPSIATTSTMLANYQVHTRVQTYPNIHLVMDFKQGCTGTHPALAAAAKKTLELRGDDGIGWCKAGEINF